MSAPHRRTNLTLWVLGGAVKRLAAKMSETAGGITSFSSGLCPACAHTGGAWNRKGSEAGRQGSEAVHIPQEIYPSLPTGHRHRPGSPLPRTDDPEMASRRKPLSGRWHAVAKGSSRLERCRGAKVAFPAGEASGRTAGAPLANRGQQGVDGLGFRHRTEKLTTQV